MPARRWKTACSSIVAFVGAVLVLGQNAAAASAGEFPYIAYVVEPETPVRSGPGSGHYATEQLAAGHAVEIFRHDGAGWCAIRPPEGSFSLVPLQQVRMVDQRSALVEGHAVPSRVGSRVSENRNAVQVMLDRGEAVALIEPPSPTSPLVRIAPPAGEFRWVAASRLSRVPPTESKQGPAAGGGWQSPPSASGSAVVAAGRIATPEPRDGAAPLGDPFSHLRGAPASGVGAPSALAAGGANPAWLPDAALRGAAAVPASTTGAAGGDDIQIVVGSPAEVQQAQYLQAETTVASAAAPAASGAPPLIDGSVAADRTGPPRIRFEGLTAGAPLDPRVAEMQVRLSQIVVGPPTAWQFAGLREETAALLAQEQSPQCRDQLRDLLDRIATFEIVQGRYRNLAPATQLIDGMAPATGAAASAAGSALGTSDNADLLARVQRDLGVANGVTPTPGAAPPATEALYDAVGTLKPVVSRRQNAPQFALIDDHGDVVTFVTATPDVNLQAYVGQRIGVRGSRGFMPEYRRAHVMASRVTNLEGSLVK